MLVNAFYEKGKIVLPEKIKVKDERIPVVIDIPDEKLDIKVELDISKLHPKVKEMMNKISTILGPDYAYHPTHKTDKELFMEGLKDSGKYGI